MSMDSDLIIGGGLAGVTIATSFLKKGRDFRLLEASSRLGGKIETKITEEACLELGPNSFTNQCQEIFDLLERLDLNEEILEPAPAAKKRFILKKGKIVLLPASPSSILTSGALSLKGRLRLVSEIFYVPKIENEEESVWDFFARHFGSEVANYFADPFVSGIYAGDAKALSLKEAFPTMANAEVKQKSLIRYLVGQRKTAKASPQSYQLRGGLESIFHRATHKIGVERIGLNELVEEIAIEGEGLHVKTNQNEYFSKTVYLTSPAYVSSKILQKNFPKLSALLSVVEYAPVISCHLRVPKKEQYPFEGFGILLPSLEKRKILGVLWNSSAFPELFPDKKHHYLTVYAGGVRMPKLLELDDSKIKKVVCDEVQEIFALKKNPEVLNLRRHARAIPQYNLGYGKILQQIRGELDRYPSLKLAGNYLGGISIPKTVAQAMEVV